MESAVPSQGEMDFTATRFGGSDYDADRDLARMSDAMGRVFEVMIRDPEQYFSLQELARASRVPQSSVGSYLCYLRRDFFFTVPKKHVENGLYLYKLGRRFSADEILERKAKKIKPVGDKELFGEMMRSMYAYAHAAMNYQMQGHDVQYVHDHQDVMDKAMREWQVDFCLKIQEGNDEQ